MLEARIDFGRQHDAGAAGEVGKEARRLGQRSLEAAALRRGTNLGVNPRPILAAKIAEFEQSIDEEPQAVLRRKAPSARMRRVDQAQLLEVLHDVSDGGRRQRNRQHPREMPRSDGLAVER